MNKLGYIYNIDYIVYMYNHVYNTHIYIVVIYICYIYIHMYVYIDDGYIYMHVCRHICMLCYVMFCYVLLCFVM